MKTLLDGVTVGGRKVSDHEQILNLAASAKRLVEMVKRGRFALSKEIFTELHGLVARDEALEWGVFRGEGVEVHYAPDVQLGEKGRHTPTLTSPGAIELNQRFRAGIDAIQAEVPHPFERAASVFLFGALQQFFFDGNKRTSRLMMNGVLLSHGIDGISIPAAQAQDFNEKMVDFYVGKDATTMMDFLVDCHPDADVIRQNRSAQVEEELSPPRV